MEALLDRVYELEGLLHLALSREDCPARLQEIIRLKGRRIAEVIASDGEVTDEKPEEVAADIPDAGPMLEEEEEMADAWNKAVAVTEEATEGYTCQTSEEVTDEATEEVTDEATEDVADETPEEVAEEVPEAETMLEVEEEMAEALEEEGTMAPAEKQRVGHLKSKFSLNDRFRFSRELFGGDTRRFDAVVDQLNDTEGFDEARDYLVSSLGWDIEADDAAAEFVEIIRPFY